jgi:hypothetical protein
MAKRTLVTTYNQGCYSSQGVKATQLYAIANAVKWIVRHMTS